MSFTPVARGTRIHKQERERRRFEKDRQALCAEGFEHVLEAADAAIDPILWYLRREHTKRKRGDHG